MSRDAKTLFVIRVVSVGEGNNMTLLRGGPQFVCDQFKSWDAGWFGRLSGATKTWKTQAGAKRWLAGVADSKINAVIEEDPREVNRRALGVGR